LLIEKENIMNQISRLPTFAFPPEFRRFAIGFDSVFDQLRNQLEVRGTDNYPPYNIIKTSDDSFVIEIAAAGFSQDELKVSVDDRILSVEGESVKESSGDVIHRGISSRNFCRTFTLAEHVEVVGAKVENGLLMISLEKIIPEHKKPKMIQIEYK
jgi:molecular chaperone IbpA